VADKSEPRPDTVSSDRSLILTPAGSFTVEGSVQETVSRLASEEWPVFSTADVGETLMVRSSEVVAVKHVSAAKGTLGFRP
jgi:hypothetical protein